jgi:6-phosphogluconolactonase
MTAPKLTVLPDAGALARRAADWLLDLSLAKSGPFAVSLSGGSTPRALYGLMAEPPYRDRLPWDRLHWFWGDERFVPHDDPLSNSRMVRQAMLNLAPVPAANVHPVPTEGITPDQAAAAYEEELKRFYGADRLDAGRPLFDVTLLGLGGDGHTASLFPGTAVLSERERWVAAVIGAKEEARITLTYPALDSSRYVAFLVEGAGKRAMLERLMQGDAELPASHVQPIGDAIVFADEAAAGPKG